MRQERSEVWGALNDLRLSSVENFAEYEHWRRQVVTLARGPGGFVFVMLSCVVVGGAWALYRAFTLRPFLILDVFRESLPIGVVGLVAGIVLILIWVHRARAKAQQQWAAGQPARDSLVSTLRGLAETWQGALTVGGIGASVDFLRVHWPDRSNYLLQRNIDAGGEARWTVTGRVDGVPVLVHVIDFWHRLSGDLQPPVLVVLVAAPLRSPDTLSAYSGNGSGVTAIHTGPPARVFISDSLRTWVAEAVRACREHGIDPDPLTAPISPTVERSANPYTLAAAFVSALARRDCLAVLAYAHPTLLFGLSREPTLSDLDSLITSESASPSDWRQPTRLKQRSFNEYTICKFDARFGNRHWVDLEIWLKADRNSWRVCSVTRTGRPKPLLGPDLDTG